MAKQEDRIVFGYEVDGQSVQLVLESTKKVEQATDSAAQAVRDMDAAAKNARGVNQIGDSASQGQGKLRGWIDQIRTATRELLGMDNAAKSAAQSSSKVQAPSGGGVLSTTKNVLGQAGGLLSTVGGGGAGSAIASAVGLTETFGPLGLAMAGVTVIASDLQRQLEIDANVLAKYVENSKKISDLVAGGATSDEIKQQITNLQSGQKAIDDQLDPLINIRNRLSELLPTAASAFTLTAEQMDEVESLIADAARLTGEADIDAPRLREYIDELSKVSIEYGESINNLGEAILMGVFRANDASAQAERDAEARQAADQKILDSSERIAAANRLTSAERQKHIDELQEEIERYQGLIDNGKLSAETIEELKGKMFEMRQEQIDYAHAVDDTADALERANKVTDAATKLMDAETNTVNAREKLAEQERETAQKQVEHERTVQKARDDAQKARDNLETETRQARTDAETKDAVDRRKALKEHLQRLEDINHQFERSAETAVSNRDAAAFDAAKQTHADAIKAEETSYKDRLDALDDALRQQYDMIDRRYNQESQRIQMAMDDAIARENERWDAEKATREQAHQGLLNDLNNYLAAEKALREAYYRAMIAAAEALQTPSPNATSGGGLPTWIGPVVGGDGGMPDGWVPFPDPTVPQGGWGGGGGYTPGGTGGLMYTRPGLLPGPSPSTNDTPVLPFMVRRGSYGGEVGMSSLTNNLGGVQFVIKGPTRRQMKQQVLTVLDQMADEVGIP